MRLKGAAPSRPRSVLIVDDEELVVKFVERVLREAGYQTATAPDGPEALEEAAKLETFDMVVTDLMMPKMTGDELWADEAFLEKPCSVKGLLQAVSLLLFGHFELSQEEQS